jgi:hypothetical protein
MKTKEITIGGVKVMLAYCFATELSFKNFTGKNIEDFEPTNPEHIIYLILSAIASYYQSKEKEEEKNAPVKDTDLMYNAKSTELIEALTEVMKLRAEWYGLPKGEAVEQPAEEQKNA